MTNHVNDSAAGKKTYVIAEMACSHEGNPALARKIIDGAGSAAADAVQFQIWRADDMAVPQHPDIELLRRLEMSWDQWSDLAQYVRQHYPTLEIIACVSDLRTVEFAETIGEDAYKLHSADLSNPPLIQRVAAKRRRIDLSVGASTLDEIAQAVGQIRETSASPIWLMYGYQTFPTPTDQIHLAYMMKLRELFELPIGYQDHSDAESAAAFWLPAAALGLGADVLEKHITHDRSKKGVDYQAALNPDEFARFVEMVRLIEAARGDGRPRPFSAEELKYRKYSKKSLVAARTLPAGTIIASDDLRPMRAERLGLPPDRADTLVGRRVKTEIAVDQVVDEDDVE